MDRDNSNEQPTGLRRGLNGIGRMLMAAATASRAEQARRAVQRQQEAEEREALRVARAAQNPTARAVYTRNALLHWVHQQYHHGDRTPVCNAFMGSLDASFEGIPLEFEDLQEAMEYLAERNLVEVIHKMNWTDPGHREIYTSHKISLTRLGLDCAESGMTVSDFLHPRSASAGDTYNTTVQSGAHNIQFGRENTMNNTWGMEPNALLQFAKDVLAKIGELDLDEAAEAELSGEAAALRDQASAQQPNPTTLRRAYDLVMSALGRAPESVASQWLHEAGTAAINSAFGG
ncbi:hypothetical protein [Streptomyces sp. 4F14]|uniref:hypothetical protein n=1 Tax=Streptomyces sp. 4F14 TaxID=3394380 RepID=UPI003A8B2B73